MLGNRYKKNNEMADCTVRHLNANLDGLVFFNRNIRSCRYLRELVRFQVFKTN